MTRSKIQLGLREGKGEKDRNDHQVPPEETPYDKRDHHPDPRQKG